MPAPIGDDPPFALSAAVGQDGRCGPDAACGPLIDAFTEAHLLVGDVAPDGEPVVALAHEALLREWPPAVRWIGENRDMLRLRAGISAAAALWRNSDQKEGRLLSGELLARRR